MEINGVRGDTETLTLVLQKANEERTATTFVLQRFEETIEDEDQTTTSSSQCIYYITI